MVPEGTGTGGSRRDHHAPTAATTPRPSTSGAYPMCDCTSRLPSPTSHGTSLHQPRETDHVNASTAAKGSRVMDGFHGDQSDDVPTLNIATPTSAVASTAGAAPARRSTVRTNTTTATPLITSEPRSRPWLPSTR